MRLFGSFRQLTQMIREYLSAETPAMLFARILARLEDDFDTEERCVVTHRSYPDVLVFALETRIVLFCSRPDLVRDIVCAIWCSNKGMTESEIVEYIDGSV